MNSSWIATHVKARYEFSVSSILQYRGYETFLPTYSVKKQWSDRTVVREMPLIPGYVFIRMVSDEPRVPVVTTPGVLNVVCFGNQTGRIEDHEITQLKTINNPLLKVEPLSYLEPGSLVRIKEGALTGMWGTVLRQNKATLLVLSIEALNRSVAVHIDPSWVELPQSPSVLVN